VIDSFALALAHGLMILAAWRLLFRPDLDDAEAGAPDAAAKPKWGFRSEKKADPGA
jgi:hypothetical protein